MKKTKDQDKLLTEFLFPIGERFFIITNDFETNSNAKNFIIGTVTKYSEYNGEFYPIYESTEESEPFSGGGIILKYSEDLENTLKNLTAKQIWIMFSSWIKK
jgi:hypothetical protein